MPRVDVSAGRGGYLSGVLRGAAKPFAYPDRVGRLAGINADRDRKAWAKAGSIAPPAAFQYLEPGFQELAFPEFDTPDSVVGTEASARGRTDAPAAESVPRPEAAVPGETRSRPTPLPEPYQWPDAETGPDRDEAAVQGTPDDVPQAEVARPAHAANVPSAPNPTSRPHDSKTESVHAAHVPESQPPTPSLGAPGEPRMSAVLPTATHTAQAPHDNGDEADEGDTHTRNRRGAYPSPTFELPVTPTTATPATATVGRTAPDGNPPRETPDTHLPSGTRPAPVSSTPRPRPAIPPATPAIIGRTNGERTTLDPALSGWATPAGPAQDGSIGSTAAAGLGPGTNEGSFPALKPRVGSSGQRGAVGPHEETGQLPPARTVHNHVTVMPATSGQRTGSRGYWQRRYLGRSFFKRVR